MTERRSARINKGARYKEYVTNGQLNFSWEKEKPLAVQRIESTYRGNTRTLKYIEKQTAVLPEIGEHDTEVDCRLYLTDEIDAAIGLIELSRQFEDKTPPDPDVFEAALTLWELSKKAREPREPDHKNDPKKKKNKGKRAAKTSKPRPKKRAKKN
ncbi:uncharacterized protein ACNLHF_024624 isoform 1-T1 [Anomaloglossus baeobatrachus]